MRRDAQTFLWDVCDSAEAITQFTAGRTLADYLVYRQMRSAVERQFEIIGEALNRLSKEAPLVAARIPALPQIVAFRNLLIHGYATVDDRVVWRTIQEDLPKLYDTAVVLLAELSKPP